MAILDITRIDTVGACSVPIMDGQRLWSIWTGGGRSAPEIAYSDDYGDTWTAWATLPNSGPNKLLTYAVLARDSQGNCYYNAGPAIPTSSEPSGIARVDATTKAVTRAFNFHVSSPGIDSWRWHTTVLPWGWTVDANGAIYMGQYTVSYWTGSAWQDGGFWGFDAHYVWKGSPDGLTWQRLDTFVNLQPYSRHVHALHCSRYDNRLICTIGDLPGRVYASDDGFATAYPILYPTAYDSEYGWSYEEYAHGCTGLTFTPDGAYLADDSNISSVWFLPTGSSIMQMIHTPPLISSAPLYYIRAVNDSELWVASYNDGGNPDRLHTLFRLREQGDGTWEQLDIYQAGAATGWTSPYAMSHDGHGSMPPHPYLYYSHILSGSGPAPGVYRIQVVSLELATEVGGGGVTLSWEGGNESIQRSTDGGQTYAQIATNPTSPYTDTTASGTVQYRALIGGVWVYSESVSAPAKFLLASEYLPAITIYPVEGGAGADSGTRGTAVIARPASGVAGSDSGVVGEAEAVLEQARFLLASEYLAAAGGSTYPVSGGAGSTSGTRGVATLVPLGVQVARGAAGSPGGAGGSARIARPASGAAGSTSGVRGSYFTPELLRPYRVRLDDSRRLVAVDSSRRSVSFDE